MAKGSDYPRKVFRRRSLGAVRKPRETFLGLLKTLRKKYYYAQKAGVYLKQSDELPAGKKRKKGIVGRYVLFFRQPRKLFQKSFQGLRMLLMKAGEFGVGGVGYVFTSARREQRFQKDVVTNRKKSKINYLTRRGVSKCLTLLPIKQRLVARYIILFRRWPNLYEPRTFNEKLLLYKLSYTPLFVRCADKVLAKEFVKEKIGQEYIVPTLFSGKTLPKASQRKWAIPYVIKANNGSGTNIFIRSRADEDWSIIEKQVKSWLATQYGNVSGEMHYTKIIPQILVEPFISSDNELPVDYKVFVFCGTPHYIQVDTGREKNHKRAYFDVNWHRMEFNTGGYEIEGRKIEKPDNLERMLESAAKLGEEFPFVRVDFYEVNGRLYFGEMTFYPGGGDECFVPGKFDLHFGSLWQ